MCVYCAEIQQEVSMQKQKDDEELREMEKLLEVARSEHSKAVSQLQELTRRVSLDKERAVEVAEMGRSRLETELASSRKELESLEAEKNQLLVYSLLCLLSALSGVNVCC